MAHSTLCSKRADCLLRTGAKADRFRDYRLRSAKGRPLTAETDYLIVGAGAVGLAFADTLLAETDAHLTIVDREVAPGGHWNHAYPFVALHQPSMIYGVNSRALGTGEKDRVGHNAGLYELASGSEVLSYFDQVMRRDLLPSGRVSYYPLSEYKGDQTFISLASGVRTKLKVRRKTVDATYMEATVPALHTPRFKIGEGVRFVAPHALPGELRRGPVPGAYVILGGGKTAMDVAHWLLTTGVAPDAITWVRPRDSWLLNRQTVQPSMDFFAQSVGGQAAQMEAYAAADDVDDLFARLERAEIMLRIDRTVKPSMMRFATISKAEIELLCRIKRVIRRGRVRAIHASGIEFSNGEERVPDTPLYIDCTASAAAPRPLQPIFQGDRIVLQFVRSPLTVLSAAMIAFVEAHNEDDITKNALCAPVTMSDSVADYVPIILANMANQRRQSPDRKLRAWMRNARLDGFAGLMASVDADDVEKLALVHRIRKAAPDALANLTRIAAAAKSAS